MEKEAFISLLKNPPEEYSVEQLNQLEALLGQYPYFQNAWALHLKGLKPFDDTAYNKALKRAAALTTDREVLFEFISNEEFTQNQLAEGHPAHENQRDEDSEAVLAIPDTDLDFAPAESETENELLPQEDASTETETLLKETSSPESEFEYVDAGELPEELWQEDPEEEEIVSEEMIREEEVERVPEQTAEAEAEEASEVEPEETEAEAEEATEVEPEDMIEVAPVETAAELGEATEVEPQEAAADPEIPELAAEELPAKESTPVDDQILSEIDPFQADDYLDELMEEPLSENDHLLEPSDFVSDPLEEGEPSFKLSGDSEPLENLEPVTEEETEMDLISDAALSMGHTDEANLKTHPMFQTDFEWDREEDVVEDSAPKVESGEKKSFSDWLVMTQASKSTTEQETPLINDAERERKFELLDKFLETNPRIIPVVSEEITVDIEESVNVDRKEIMTETLAQLYREQGKFKKALKGYEVLRLKYPEKSSFFAAQIQELKALIKEKKKN